MLQIRTHLPLLRELVVREIGSRFAGSIFGFLWALIGPLLLLGIYTIVFGQILKQRIAELPTENYVFFVALALWPWMMFSDGVLRGLSSIQSNANLVKKVAFPHVLLVIASVMASFALHLAGFAAVLVLLAVTGSPIKLAGLPYAGGALVLLFALTLGVAMFFAALQALMRDVEMAVSPAISMLHFLTPIIYPLSMIPESFRDWLTWNPLAGIVTAIRHALLAGAAPSLDQTFLAALIVIAIALAAGAWLFNRLSPYFEDFL